MELNMRAPSSFDCSQNPLPEMRSLVPLQDYLCRTIEAILRSSDPPPSDKLLEYFPNDGEEDEVCIDIYEAKRHTK